MCVAPDGSLFVADWYDPGVGGHNQQDVDRGRIFRVAPPGAKYTVPKYDFSDGRRLRRSAEKSRLERALPRVRGAARRWAQTAGARRLHDHVSDADNEPRFGPRLCCSAQHRWPTAAEAVVAEMVSDLQGRESRHPRAGHSPGPRCMTWTSAAVAVRGQGLRSGSPPRAGHRAAAQQVAGSAPSLWADLAAQYDGKDRWYLEALGIAADKQWDAFLDAYLAKVSEPWKTPAGRDILWRSRAKQTPALLVKIIKDPATTEADQPRYFRTSTSSAGPEKEAALKSLLE